MQLHNQLYKIPYSSNVTQYKLYKRSLKEVHLIPTVGAMFSGEEVPRTWLHTGLCGEVVGVCWIL